MKEKNIFKKIIKMFPCTFIMILGMLVFVLVFGVLALLDDASIVFEESDGQKMTSAILVILGMSLVTDFIIAFVKKITAKNKENKELKKKNTENEKQDFINNNLENIKAVNSQNDLDYIAITNGEISKEDVIPDNLNELIKKDKLYSFKNDESNLFVELFINSSKYNFKIDCKCIKQLFLTKVNQIMIPYSLTIITNDGSRLVIIEGYRSNIDNLKKVVEYIKSLNSLVEVTNEIVYEGYKTSLDFNNPLVIDYKYSLYKKEISNRVIEHQIEKISFEDIVKIEYTNYDNQNSSIQNNFLKIYTSKYIYLILYNKKIDDLIQNLNKLPLQEVNDLINRKWYFGKNDEGTFYSYFDMMEENSEFKESMKKYREDSYVLNKKTEEFNLFKTYSSLRKDGTSFDVTFYYNTNEFNKYDIKSNGQIMLLSDGKVESSFMSFINYDCYAVKSWDEYGDNLYINTNYAFMFNTENEFLVGLDINDIKSIECIRDDVLYIFRMYTSDGSMLTFTPFIQDDRIDDILDPFLIINPDIIANKRF